MPNNEPKVIEWAGSKGTKWCIVADDFLGRDGKYHQNTTENERWSSKQEAEAFLKNFLISKRENDIKTLQETLENLKAEAENEDCYITGIYRSGVDKFLLGYADGHLQLFGSNGHWYHQPFKVTGTGKYRDNKPLWRIVNEYDKNLMKKYSYVRESL